VRRAPQISVSWRFLFSGVVGTGSTYPLGYPLRLSPLAFVRRVGVSFSGWLAFVVSSLAGSFFRRLDERVPFGLRGSLGLGLGLAWGEVDEILDELFLRGIVSLRVADLVLSLDNGHA